MAKTLFRGALLVTMNPAREVFTGDLLVQDDRIAALARSPGSPAAPESGRDLTVIEAHGCALLPGFVQAHVHLCQTLFRNHAEDLPLLPWLQRHIWPMEAAHTERSMRLSVRLGIAELLAGGTTALLDMGSVHHYETVFAEAEAQGMRLVGGKCMMDAGENVPRGLRETTAASLQESERLRQRWHGAAAGRLRYAYAPRFALSCSGQLLREVGELARAQGCLVHTHAGETEAEEQLLLQHKQRRTLDYLRHLGLAGAHCCFAHGVQFRPEEVASLAADQTRMAHCPSANLKLGSGLAPVTEMLRAGVCVGLGADGAACNNHLDMFHEMRLAGLVQRLRLGPAAMSAQQIVEMATLGGAACLGWQNEIGSLETGKKADLVLLRLETPHATPPNPDDPYTQIVYAAGSGDVLLTMVDGRILFHRGEFTRLEVKKLLSDCREEMRQLLQRVSP